MTLDHPARGNLLAAASVAAIAALAAPGTYATALTVDIPGLSCTTPTITANGNTISIACPVTNPPPPPPPTGPVPTDCFAVADQMYLPATGGKIALGAACLTNSPTSYTWTRNGAPFGTPASGNFLGNDQTDTLPANTLAASVTYNYVVYASNANGNSAAFSVPVTVAGVPGGGSGGGSGGGATGAISCPGFNKTLIVDVPWLPLGGGRQFTTSGNSGFGWNDALVVRFTVPAGKTSTASGYLALAEWGGGPSFHVAAISASPCDFTQGAPNPWYIDGNKVAGTNTLQPEFMVGGTWPGFPVLNPGTTYYLNVRNISCPTGSNCDLFIDFKLPDGTN